MFFRSSHRETNQARVLFQPACNTSTITPQKVTELENAHVANLGKVTTTSHHISTQRYRL